MHTCQWHFSQFLVGVLWTGGGGGSSQQCGSDFHQNIIEEDIKDVVHGSLSPDPSNIL